MPRHPKNVGDSTPPGGTPPRKPGPVSTKKVDPPKATAQPIKSQKDDHCPACFRWSTWENGQCTASDCGALADGARPRGTAKPLPPIKGDPALVWRPRKRSLSSKIANLFRKRR